MRNIIYTILNSAENMNNYNLDPTYFKNKVDRLAKAYSWFCPNSWTANDISFSLICAVRDGMCTTQTLSYIVRRELTRDARKAVAKDIMNTLVVIEDHLGCAGEYIAAAKQVMNQIIDNL